MPLVELTEKALGLILGSVYLYTGAIIALLVHELARSNTQTYPLIMSRKGTVLGFKYAILMTCLTVSYQYFFQDFSAYLLWWRVALISLIAGSVTKWWVYAKKVNGELLYEP